MTLADDVVAALAPLREAGNWPATAITSRIRLAADPVAETHRQLTDLAGCWQVCQHAACAPSS